VIKKPRHLLKGARSVWDLTKAGSVTAAARVTAMVITTIIIAVVRMGDTHPMVATGMALPHHLLRNANLAGVEMIGAYHLDPHQLISLTTVDDQTTVESDQDHKTSMADIAALIVITYLRETEQAVVETSTHTYQVTIRIEDLKTDDPTTVDATTAGMTADQTTEIVEDTTEFVTTMVVEIAVIALGIVAAVPEVLLVTVGLIGSGSENL
jgi:hypothetical protein